MFAMTGCSWLFHDRTNDYLQSEIQAPIQIPKDVALLSIKPQLPIPSVANKDELPKEFVLPRPERLTMIEDKVDVSLSEVSNKQLETELVKDGNGTPILRLNVGFARAWSELGESIKKSSVKITDLNRSIGTYYIEVEDSDAVVEQGFWASLFGSEPEKVMLSYQVKLNQARSGVYVAIHLDQDNLADDDIAKTLLESIQKNI
jgi:outer membrane protein assembly factor BamC